MDKLILNDEEYKKFEDIYYTISHRYGMRVGVSISTIMDMIKDHPNFHEQQWYAKNDLFTIMLYAIDSGWPELADAILEDYEDKFDMANIISQLMSKSVDPEFLIGKISKIKTLEKHMSIISTAANNDDYLELFVDEEDVLMTLDDSAIALFLKPRFGRASEKRFEAFRKLTRHNERFREKAYNALREFPEIVSLLDPEIGDVFLF